MRLKTRALDSWPILEWINQRETAATVLEQMLEAAERGEVRLVMSAINAGEIYYFLEKNHPAGLSQMWRDSCATLPVTIEVPNMDEIWSASALKGRHPISYADAFAAAIAQKYDCPLVTGDPDFKQIPALKLEWIGR